MLNQSASILVVDDTPANLTLMTGLLQDTYHVRAAISGEKALKIASSENPPDLIYWILLCRRWMVMRSVVG